MTPRLMPRFTISNTARLSRPEQGGCRLKSTTPPKSPPMSFAQTAALASTACPTLHHALFQLCAHGATHGDLDVCQDGRPLRSQLCLALWRQRRRDLRPDARKGQLQLSASLAHAVRSETSPSAFSPLQAFLAGPNPKLLKPSIAAHLWQQVCNKHCSRLAGLAGGAVSRVRGYGRREAGGVDQELLARSGGASPHCSQGAPIRAL